MLTPGKWEFLIRDEIPFLGPDPSLIIIFQELIFFGDKVNEEIHDGDTDLKVEFGDLLGFAFYIGSAEDHHGIIAHSHVYGNPQPGLYE